MNLLISKNNFITEQIQLFPYADKTVIEFIANFKFAAGREHVQAIENLYTNGYCFHFAHILLATFNTGFICYVLDKFHIVWVTIDRTGKYIAYDINGVYRDYHKLIQIEEIGEIIKDYKHIPNDYSTLTNIEETNLFEDLLKEKRYIEKDQQCY